VPQTTLTSAEAHADAVVRQLRAGRCEPGPIVARLRASHRPYFTWAAAWAVMSGLAERDPDDAAVRAGLEALRRVEPVASELDLRALNGETGPVVAHG